MKDQKFNDFGYDPVPVTPFNVVGDL